MASAVFTDLAVCAVVVVLDAGVVVPVVRFVLFPELIVSRVQLEVTRIRVDCRA